MCRETRIAHLWRTSYTHQLEENHGHRTASVGRLSTPLESIPLAVLKLIKGGNVGQLLPLGSERTVLGRHPSCQIVLDNAAISRQHAQVLESHGSYFLEDLRSRNGTHLNDMPVKGRVELKDGDEVKLCDFVFHFLESASSVTSVPGAQIRPGSKRLPLQARSKETISEDGDGPFVPADADAVEESVDSGAQIEGSSIITSLEAEQVRTVRLNVRPEVKLRAMMQISSALGRVLKLDDVLPVILDSLFKIFPQADWGIVVLKGTVSGDVVVRASKSRYAAEESDIPLSLTIVQQAMDGGRAILSADALRDRRFSSSESLADLQIRSVMCAPLMNPSGRALGVIQMTTRDLEQQFSSDDLDLLASVSSQCGLAIENAQLHESLVAQRDLDRELEFATQVQLGFLPSAPPLLSDYEFADFYEPAHHVGGDYFDYIRLPNGRVAIAIGDVAGKGVPAALLMARLHASVRYHLLSATSAGEALTSLNCEIINSGLGYRFITLALLVIDPEQHELHLTSAGHLPPVLRSSDGSVQAIGVKESGMPLGVTATQSYRELRLALQPGDSLLLYTDGVTEAMSVSHEIYSRQRLAQVFSQCPATVTDVIPALLSDVEKFCQGGPQRDDICLVAIRRLEQLGSVELPVVSTAQLPTVQADEG
jgi:phosphoserine phosphatase RsbU/P